MQVKADIQNTNINILRSSEGGLCGCAMLQSVALGSTNSLYDAKKIFVEYTKEFVPDLENHMRYEEQYKKYKKLYNTLKEIF
jgi:xylulokinase